MWDEEDADMEEEELHMLKRQNTSTCPGGTNNENDRPDYWDSTWGDDSGSYASDSWIPLAEDFHEAVPDAIPSVQDYPRLDKGLAREESM